MFTADPYYLSDKQLAELAANPECSNAKECAELLEKRIDERAAAQEKENSRRADVRERLNSDPFDPRNEVSADARHISKQIVKHLWIIFVALPFVLAILYAIMSSGSH